MKLSLQISLLMGSVITLLFIIVITKKVNMNIRYNIVWLLWGVIIFLLSLFPHIIDYLSLLLGISIPTNTLFLIFIFLLYLMNFYLFIKVSEMDDKIKSLTYSQAKTDKELEELKRKLM